MSKQETARFTVEMPTSGWAGILIRRWAGYPGVALRILKGRVSLDLSRFELEVQGAPVQVSRIIQQSSRWQPA